METFCVNSRVVKNKFFIFLLKTNGFISVFMFFIEIYFKINFLKKRNERVFIDFIENKRDLVFYLFLCKNNTKIPTK